MARAIAVQQDAHTGEMPHIAPHHGTEGSPAWSSAAILVPWYCFQAYGDIRFMREHYLGMRRYVEHLTTTAVDGIQPLDCYGDHLSADPGWSSAKPEMTST